MGYHPLPLTKLIEQFASLPGIGMKTAQRLAFYILTLSDQEAKDFAGAVLEAHSTIKHCEICKNFTDTPVCSICSDPTRDHSVVCVVEDPKDVSAFERTREYKGTYHVLHGLITAWFDLSHGGDRPRSAFYQGASRTDSVGYRERSDYGDEPYGRGRGYCYVSLEAFKAFGGQSDQTRFRDSGGV